MKLTSFLKDAYYHIEKQIQDNARGKNISKSGMANVLASISVLGVKLANQFYKQRIKKHPKLKGKIDTCWLQVYCSGLIAVMWASAVSRGKSFDKKRNIKGRRGWARGHKDMLLELETAYQIGEEIVNERLAEDGDFNPDVEINELTKELFKRYTKR